MPTVGSLKSILYLEGVLFFLLGLAAIIVPQFFTVGIALLIGILLIIGGVFQLFHLFHDKGAPFWGSLIGGIISIIIGILMLIFPMAGILSLTLLLITYFILDGLAKLYLAFNMRSYQHWGWVLFSGIVSLILAALIFSGLPGTAIWTLGLLLGIDMLFFGFSLFGIAASIQER